MSIRNRELSQFGSFIYIEDSTKSIGITTTATPNVGIGTTNATHKLEVIGDTNIDGNVSISGIVTATKFYGDGSSLSNVTSIIVDGWIFEPTGIHTLTNVGVGTTNPTSKLTVEGDILTTGIITASNITLSGGSVSSGIVTASRFSSTVTTGTSPFTVNSTTLVTNLNADLLQGRTPPIGDFVGSSDNQTLTNKTLQSPRVTGIGISFVGSTSGVTNLSAQSVASGNILLPAISGIGTIITTADVGSITSDMIQNLTISNADIASNAAITYGKLSLSNSIVNADIATGAGITYGKLSLSNSIGNADISSTAAIANSKLANSTISGVSLGSNLNDLSLGTYLSYNTGTTYNGSGARTINTNATSSNTSSALVARDASGDFAAGTITATLSGNATSATTATNANNINISSTTSTDTTTSVVLVANQSTGNQSPFIDSGLTYNANTNALSATTFIGDLSGNASTATTADFATSASTANSATTATTASTANTLSNAANITTGTINSARLSGTYSISISGNAASATSASTATNFGPYYKYNIGANNQYYLGSGYHVIPSFSVDATSGYARHSRNSSNPGDGILDYYSNFGSSNRNVARVNSNGDHINITGVYSNALSDLRFKTDIVDSPSQWEDVKAIKIKKFRYKADPFKEVYLGPIAQELEEVCPNLVIKRPATESDVRDADFPLEEGDEVLTWKQSILPIKAFVALQEAMQRIEELEKKVAELENK